MFMLWQGTIIKGAATTITAITALPENWIIWGVTVLFVLFGVAGGLVATVMTDFIQGIFILILSFVLIPFGLKAVGGFTGLHQTLADAPQMFFPHRPEGVDTLYDRDVGYKWASWHCRAATSYGCCGQR
jgi:Na+/proline symporter